MFGRRSVKEQIIWKSLLTYAIMVLGMFHFDRSDAGDGGEHDDVVFVEISIMFATQHKLYF